ncbi:MAG: hypothetical protein FWD15_06035 [Alphaproteobacteria bacterium]|nr:hypothetical protein [Alphaproteobacteria bacterium]
MRKYPIGTYQEYVVSSGLSVDLATKKMADAQKKLDWAQNNHNEGLVSYAKKLLKTRRIKFHYYDGSKANSKCRAKLSPKSLKFFNGYVESAHIVEELTVGDLFIRGIKVITDYTDGTITVNGYYRDCNGEFVIDGREYPVDLDIVKLVLVAYEKQKNRDAAVKATTAKARAVR